ncbi:type VI secretion system contractile sheath domain-containing protein [Pseudovibrio sp. Alg231-02]|uniref:type VI secretion system contractile sheath domain-containing protein n=1 Tax=Pseudovibrio sp. Alg231-02 TaxID=1922223 RepID=UPI000D55430C|nr:type VI secretion system contractile sheath large subunit [Pseudovibrio sp. Alg231-02]
MSDSDKDDDLDALLNDIIEESDAPTEGETAEGASASVFEPDFGEVTCEAPKLNITLDSPFHLAVIGDFSGRANRMALYNADELAVLKGHNVDVDTAEDLPARFKINIELDLAGDEKVIRFEPNCIEDFHPDEIIDEFEIFDELKALRSSLKNPGTFSNAAATIDEWLENKGEKPVSQRNSRGSVIPVDKKLSDFSALIDRPVEEHEEADDFTDLIGKIVSPHITPADNPQLDDYLEIVETVMTTTLRKILQNADFQSLESVWRVIDMLSRRIETSTALKITLYDISAEDFARDLSATNKLEETGLYRLFVENALQDEGVGTPSAIVGLYTFDMTPPHAELLGRMSKICAHAHAPFLTSLDRNNATRKFAELPKITEKTWQSLRAMPESNYIGLSLPRFMLRMPYGAKTDPIDAFNFEEFDEQVGLKAMLWGNPAALIGLVLAKDYETNGGGMKPGSILTLNEMPFHYVHDQYGDQVALPCTDRMISHRSVEPLMRQSWMPIVSMKGQPEVRIASLDGLAGDTISGRWCDQIAVTKAAETPSPSAGARVSISGGDGLTPGIQATKGAVVVETIIDPKKTPETIFRIEADPPEPQVSEPEAAEEEEDEVEEAPVPAPAAAAAPPAPVHDTTELDNLLADLSADDEEEADEEGMDPELEALLADL